MSFGEKLKLRDYVYAGYSGIAYNTSEEERAISECAVIAELTKSRLFIWSLTNGIVERIDREDADGNKIIEHKTINKPDDLMPPFDDVLRRGLGLDDRAQNGNVIFCLLDYHPYIKQPEAWRTAKDVFKKAKEKFITYIFISSKIDIPLELEHEIISVNMEWPDESDLREVIDNILNDNERFAKISEEDKNKACKAALGLTLVEAENAFSTALSKSDHLDLGVINEVKKEIICKDGLLEYQKSNESIETIGGMKPFVNYVSERFLAYADEAREYGLPYPKGVLLAGIPGCGKSLAAKALSNMWQVPLLKLDLGKLFSSYVGDTEANTRRALKIAESMSPCVLWLDEIEKALAGVGNSGKMDSGVSSRMFGTILTWLQEKLKPVYVIATANNLNALPPELTRKGRFDEIFFVDLPNLEERKEIIEIQLKKHKGLPENFDCQLLAENSDGFNGAEIEEAVISAMFKGFADNKRPYNADDILHCMSTIKPASKGIMSGTVDALRRWAKENNVRNANNESQSLKVTEIVTTGRKIMSQSEIEGKEDKAHNADNEAQPAKSAETEKHPRKKIISQSEIEAKSDT